MCQVPKNTEPAFSEVLSAIDDGLALPRSREYLRTPNHDRFSKHTLAEHYDYGRLRSRPQQEKRRRKALARRRILTGKGYFRRAQLVVLNIDFKVFRNYYGYLSSSPVITGNLGQALLRAGVSQGHQIRGLSRSPDKLSPDLRASLESFVSLSTYYDIPAIEKAVAGVDAVISVNANVPGLTLEGQLILLRAAERAGVKRYVATSWNADWTKFPLGKHESYDEFIMFKRHLDLSNLSSGTKIKPIYIFTNILAEFAFRAPSDMTELPELPWWDPKNGTAVYYGDGKCRWQWTTFADTAAYTIDIVTSKNAENGGGYSVLSDAGDAFYLARTWKEVTGKDIKLIPAGDVEGLRDLWKKYIGPFYWLHQIEGDWKLDEDRLYIAKARYCALRPPVQVDSLSVARVV
ncbi:hypothetical protein MMC18_007361 [Xylographa bjoerkii]|nr:hypothetical protein [Xylographa bjoerkii]